VLSQFLIISFIQKTFLSKNYFKYYPYLGKTIFSKFLIFCLTGNTISDEAKLEGDDVLFEK